MREDFSRPFAWGGILFGTLWKVESNIGLPIKRCHVKMILFDKHSLHINSLVSGAEILRQIPSSLDDNIMIRGTGKWHEK